MLIDINTQKKSFAKRLFLSFKFMANYGCDKLSFIKQWITTIENLERKPELKKEFFGLVDIKGIDTSEVETIYNGFLSLK